MTPRTSQRKPHEGAAEGIHLLVDNIGEHLGRVLFGDNLGAENKKSGADQRVQPGLVSVGI